MDSKQSLHTLSPGPNSFVTTSHLMLKLMFLFLNFQTCSINVLEVLLCSNLKDDLCKYAKSSNATACKSLLKPIKSCRLLRHHIGSDNSHLKTI